MRDTPPCTGDILPNTLCQVHNVMVDSAMLSTPAVSMADQLSSLDDERNAVRWNPAALFFFRVVAVYSLLQWLPLFLALQTPALTFGRASAPPWWYFVNATVGQWTASHVLRLPEHSPAQMSANNLPLFLGMVVLIFVSGVAASVWSVLQRHRHSHPALLLWLHTFLRYALGGMVLMYGWAKVFPAQFALSFDYLTLPVGQHSPRDLLWAFMGASREYQVFAGIVEVTGGMLLFARRTTLLGACLTVMALGNVVALDIAYDAPVKFLAAQLLLIALFVLAPFAKALIGTLLLDAHGISPVMLRQHKSRLPATIAGIVVATWITGANLQAARRQVDQIAGLRDTPLYGIWQVDSDTSARGADAASAETATWRRLVVQSVSSAVILHVLDPDSTSPNAGRYSVRLDRNNRTVRLVPFAFSGSSQTLEFAYEITGGDLLILRNRDGGEAPVLHLRRVDPYRYSLLKWQRTWSW